MRKKDGYEHETCNVYEGSHGNAPQTEGLPIDKDGGCAHGRLTLVELGTRCAPELTVDETCELVSWVWLVDRQG